MAKTSQRVRQARPAKYKTRAYTRCRRCGRARSVYRKFGVCRICLGGGGGEDGGTATASARSHTTATCRA
jgi:small subunit ribosomal protein S14